MNREYTVVPVEVLKTRSIFIKMLEFEDLDQVARVVTVKDRCAKFCEGFRVLMQRNLC